MSAAPSPPRELHGIQMLRGLAAAMVVAHHMLEVAVQGGALAVPNWLVTAGASGVDIFFVISGCIMVHTSFREDKPPLTPGTFLGRRLTRIFPIYWIACAALFLLLHLRHADSVHLSDSVLALLLLPGDIPLIPYSWTLDYELYFYVLFAVALLCRNAAGTVAATVVAMAAVAFLATALPAGAWATFLADPVPAEFVAGMMLILAMRRCASRGRRWPLHPAVALPALAAMTVAPAFIAHTGTVGLPGWPRVAAWGIPATLAVAALLMVGPPRNAVQRAAVSFGDASYSLYLSHVFAMIAYRHALDGAAIRTLSQLIVAPIVFLLACALGVLVHLTIEVPLMNLVRRLGDRRRLTQTRPWSV